MRKLTVSSFQGKHIDSLTDYLMAPGKKWVITGSEEGWTRYFNWWCKIGYQVFYGADGIITSIVKG